MYVGVPTTTPLAVSSTSLASTALAIPKSISRTWRSPPSSMMFSGLTSRWITPAWWAADSAAAASSRMRRTSLMGSRFSLASSAFRLSPRMSGITM